MKTEDIKYNSLSTNYDRLYELLKQNIVVVGFSSPEHKGKTEIEFSNLITMYSAETSPNYLQVDGAMFEKDFSKEKIIERMKRINVRFFDIQNEMVCEKCGDVHDVKIICKDCITDECNDRI